MADTEISALTELTSLAADDELVIVDKSDTTMAASGTDKRVKKSTLDALYATGAVNVKDYGATGDGSTDDTAAIVAAKAATPAGGTLLFPPGTYMTNLIQISTAITVEIAVGATVKLRNARNEAVFFLNSSGCRIVGRGTIDGNRVNQTTWGTGIDAGSSNLLIEGITIQNTFVFGISAYQCDNLTIRNCKISENGDSGIFVDVYTATRSNIRIIDNEVDRSAESAVGFVGMGIKVKGDGAGIYAEDVTIARNRVKLPVSPDGYGLCIEVWFGVKRGVIADNITQNGEMGISVDSSHSVAVTGNSVYNANGVGIEVAAASEGVTVTGNAVDGNGLTNTGLSGTNTTPTRVAYVGNVIKGCTNRCVTIQNAEKVALVGNMFDLGVAGATYAVELIAVTKFLITGNTLDGANAGGASTGLKALVIQTSSEGVVSGNLIRNFTQHGISAFQNAAGTMDNISITGNSIMNCNVWMQFTASGGGVLGPNIVTTPNQVTNIVVSVASAATITAGDGQDYFDVTGTTNITSITASWPGRLITLKFAGVLTVTDGSNLKLAGSFTTSAEATLTLRSDGTNWWEVARRPDAAYQPLDSDLTSIAALTSAADRLPYFTGSGTASLATFTAAGRALIDDADASAQLTTLGLSAFIKTLVDDADAATARATLGAGADLLAQNTQTGNYTLVLGDQSKVIEMNVAGANTLTVPPNSSVAFPVGAVIEVYQMGAGQTTLTPGGGVTLREREAKLKTAGQYASVTLRKRATDEWVVSGDAAA